MNKIIPLNVNYEFIFLEDKVKISHPLSEYYLKLDDLSINLYISFKWIKWGYFFLKSICDGLDNIKDDYEMSYIISKGIQDIKRMDEKKKIIILDDKEIESELKLDKTILEDYSWDYIDTNTKIHMKLKMNLREFLILSYMLYPSLIKWDEKKSFS